MAGKRGITLRGHDNIAAFFGSQGFDHAPGVKHDALKPYRELAVLCCLDVKSEATERAAKRIKQFIDANQEVMALRWLDRLVRELCETDHLDGDNTALQSALKRVADARKPSDGRRPAPKRRSTP